MFPDRHQTIPGHQQPGLTIDLVSKSPELQLVHLQQLFHEPVADKPAKSRQGIRTFRR